MSIDVTTCRKDGLRSGSGAVLAVLAALAAFFAVQSGSAEAKSRKPSRPAMAAPLVPFVENRPPVRAPGRSLTRLSASGSAMRPGAQRARSAQPRPKAIAATTIGVAAVAAAAKAIPLDKAAASTPLAAPDDKPAIGPDGPAMTMDAFLDRLMIAESGGRLEARNPRSTALGPFQFIESTFLAVARRHFPAEIAGKSPAEILALRTDLAFSRKAAEAYTRDNATVLQSHDVAPSYPNLRLAFLLGSAGAVKVLKAAPEAPLVGLLAPAVLVANPFMASLTAGGLVSRSAREVNQPPTTRQGVDVPPGTALPQRALAPAVSVRCNLRLPSCKRWLALETAKLRGPRKGARASTVANAAATGMPSTAARLGGPVSSARR